jgi:DNA-binding HxlR family transcriptional regulator
LRDGCCYAFHSVVLWYLRKDRRRFSELKNLIPNITEKMLSLQLKDLEGAGIIGRKVYPEVPPRVEYFLTPFGKTLIPMLEEIARWGRAMGEERGKIVEKNTIRKVVRKSATR